MQLRERLLRAPDGSAGAAAAAPDGSHSAGGAQPDGSASAGGEQPDGSASAGGVQPDGSRSAGGDQPDGSASAGVGQPHVALLSPPSCDLDCRDDDGLPLQDKLVMCLIKTPDLGVLYEHCVMTVRQRLHQLGGLALFKIGIAISAYHRWMNPGFGYRWDRQDGWRWMDVIALETVPVAKQMEVWLIAEFGERMGCRNINPGGEGIRDESSPTCHVYAVYTKVEGMARLWRVAQDRRKRQGLPAPERPE